VTRPTVQRLDGFGLTARDARRLSEFYQAAFDCRLLNTGRLEGSAFETLMAVHGGAHRITLALGEQTIEILQFDAPGRAYVEPLSPRENSFQHFALVVSDMDSAWRRLATLSGWTAMTTGGPQLLPPRSGNVKAFKFRDPEGHPLEFLEFSGDSRPAHWSSPSGRLFLGIDHSALSVTDVDASIDFYRQLGLLPSTRTLNYGPEQERLDGIVDPQVDVVALELACGIPHVELLHYRTTEPRHPVTFNSNDLAATRLVMRAVAGMDEKTHGSLLQDPDGHSIELRFGET
jgi:catechol 2,3-dioxygenase-like lactoylglutathione lyase family enzyme